jgi:hypothetical protein
MSCASPLRELVTFWLAGTLDPAEAEEVARHVTSCADCRADVSDGRMVFEGLRELHLTADEVVAAAASELTSPHLLVCSRCRDEVATLQAVNADLGKSASRGSSWRAFGAAVAAAAAVALAVWIAPWRQPAETVRGGSAAAVDVAAVTTSADGVPTFDWTPISAQSYRVTVFSQDGRPVWTLEAAAPPVRWPADVLRAPGAYRWWVEAFDNGRMTARSRLAEFEVPR